MGFVYHKNIVGEDLHIPKDHKHPGNEVTYPISSKTENYTIQLTDVIITVNAISTKITISLPTASSAENKLFYIKKIDSSDNSVFVDANGSETIDDCEKIEMTGQYDCITVVSDGTEWWIV